MAVIRKASVDDVRGLVLLLQGIGWFERFNQSPIGTLIEQVRACIEQCLAEDSHLLLVAEDPENHIVGYGSVHWLPYLFMSGPEGYVSELFVGPAERGRGIGRQLLGAIEEAARARGCQRLSLINLRTRESYQRQFYVKAGWRERTEAASFIYPLA